MKRGIKGLRVLGQEWSGLQGAKAPMNDTDVSLLEEEKTKNIWLQDWKGAMR